MTRRIIGNDGLCWLDHGGVVAESAAAKCFRIEGEDIWIPLSQVKDENDELVAIPQWLADKKGLESKW